MSIMLSRFLSACGLTSPLELFSTNGDYLVRWHPCNYSSIVEYLLVLTYLPIQVHIFLAFSTPACYFCLFSSPFACGLLFLFHFSYTCLPTPVRHFHFF